MFDEAHPRSGVVRERAARFDKDGFAGEPKIGDARRDDTAFLIDLAGEQLCVQTALIDRASFACAGFSDHKDRGQG